ncbi:MAG TPA: hypothetical protein VFE24_14030 [Pirellulales bacterium]|jgi:hypothetical protein|nr:hypothetical protein [Pirellulales bacterium]
MNEPIPFVRGRRIGLSLPRRFVGDLLYEARKLPSIPVQRKMRLAAVKEARAAWPRHVSWCAIFLKAYSIVSAKQAELRRAYISFPWGHLYEHPLNVASFSVERSYRGENGVFFGRIASPETIPLTALDRLIREYESAEFEQVASFRQAMLLSRFPKPIRRFIWWFGLSTDGAQRARFFGTFGISVAARFGAGSLHVLSPMTTTLNYGTFEPDGSLDVRLTYDHRCLDGATIARALGQLEETLHGEILAELSAGPAEAASPAELARTV